MLTQWSYFDSQNPKIDPEMFDPSLCPICGVQYGGNLHNVPQQGGPPFLPNFFLQKAKAQFILFVILPPREFFEMKSLALFTDS